MYYIEILLKLFGGSWNLLACVKLQIIHCSIFMDYPSIYERRFWSPSHVPLSPPAPLCLPWIWKQACRPFPLSHYHIQRGNRRGMRAEEAQDWIKREGNPLPLPYGFFIGLPFYISLPDGGRMFSVSLFLSLPALDLKGANRQRVRGEWSCTEEEE